MARKRRDPLALSEACRDRAWMRRFLAAGAAAPLPPPSFRAHLVACPACRRAVLDLVRGAAREGEPLSPDAATVALARSLAGGAAPSAAVPAAAGGAPEAVRIAVIPGPRIEGVEGATAPRTADGEARAALAVGRFRIEVLAGRAGRRWTLRARLLEGPRDAVLVLAAVREGRGERLGAKGALGTTVAWPALGPGRYRLSALSKDGAGDVEIEVKP